MNSALFTICVLHYGIFALSVVVNRNWLVFEYVV